jgi:transcriptional regulator with XRE-family HTH domain
MTTPKTKGPNPIDVYVGSRVRMRRLMLNLSQEKLGKALGLTFQQVQKYEKGVNRMGSSRLQQAADILGVTVPFFFEGATGGTYQPDGSACHDRTCLTLATRSPRRRGSRVRRRVTFGAIANGRRTSPFNYRMEDGP